MGREERLLKQIIDLYLEDGYRDNNIITKNIDIIKDYPNICFELLTIGSLHIDDRLILLEAMINNKELLDKLCNKKTYIRKSSFRELNLILPNCEEKYIYDICKVKKNVLLNKKNIESLKCDNARNELIMSYLLFEKMS